MMRYVILESCLVSNLHFMTAVILSCRRLSFAKQRESKTLYLLKA
jgi:hypothetical protein